MVSHKALVTLEDILRIVREDYPDMTLEELQKHLGPNPLVKRIRHRSPVATRGAERHAVDGSS